MGKWWHVLASVGLAAVGVLVPVVQGVIVTHPTIATILAGVWAVLGAIQPSPVKQ